MTLRVLPPVIRVLLSAGLFFVVLAVCLLILPVMAKDGVFRTGSAQTYSSRLGVNTVPTLVVIANAQHPGIYLTTSPVCELGQKMKLTSGMVLLTIDGYSMTSSKVADQWIDHRGNKPIQYTYAISVDGKARILSGEVQTGAASAGAPSSPANALHAGVAARSAMVPQAEIVQYCLTLINQSRKSNGLEPVKEDASLGRCAQDYADYMAQNQKDYEVTNERSPHTDLRGRSAPERAKLSGVTNFLNENIGRASRGDRNDRLVLSTLNSQMLNSPGHREIMLDPQAHTVGIGIARLPNRFYLTEEFGD